MNLKFRVLVHVLTTSVIAPSWVMPVLVMLHQVASRRSIYLAHPHIVIRCSSLRLPSFQAVLPPLKQ